MKYRLLLGVLFCLVNVAMFYSVAAYSDDSSVKLSGQVRMLSETDAKDFNKDSPEQDAAFLRTRLSTAFQPAEKISAFIQLQDSRLYGSEPNTLADTHNVDLHQAYFTVEDLFINKLSLKSGRFESSYGAGRLIGTVGWHNVGQAFNGSVLRYRVSEKLDIDSFGAQLIHQVDPANLKNTGRYLAGLYATYRPKETYHLDFYSISEVHSKETVKDEPDLTRHTLGAYDKGKLDCPINSNNALDYEVEVAAQLGKRHNPADGIHSERQDIRAFMLTASIGYTLDTAQKPRLAVGYDYLSGQDADDEDYKVFDTLYANNDEFYGFMDYFVDIPVDTGGSGLQDVMAKLQIAPHKKLTLKADVHHFLSAKKVDDENSYGQEVDLTAVYRYHKALGFTLGVSVFAPGELMKAKFGGNDDVAAWSYFMTTANF